LPVRSLARPQQRAHLLDDALAFEQFATVSFFRPSTRYFEAPLAKPILFT